MTAYNIQRIISQDRKAEAIVLTTPIGIHFSSF